MKSNTNIKPAANMRDPAQVAPSRYDGPNQTELLALVEEWNGFNGAINAPEAPEAKGAQKLPA